MIKSFSVHVDLGHSTFRSLNYSLRDYENQTVLNLVVRNGNANKQTTTNGSKVAATTLNTSDIKVDSATM